MSAVLSLIMVVKGPEEFRLFAAVVVSASATWLVGTYVWNWMMRRKRRSRRVA